jgi:hypothetical protein
LAKTSLDEGRLEPFVPHANNKLLTIAQHCLEYHHPSEAPSLVLNLRSHYYLTSEFIKFHIPTALCCIEQLLSELKLWTLLSFRCPKSQKGGESEHIGRRPRLDTALVGVRNPIRDHILILANFAYVVRHIKCDDLQPTCFKCTSTRRVCDGYNETPSNSLPSNINYLIETGPFLGTNASLQSRRSFAFFVQATCPQLAGFFGSDFWERLVLQAAHHESAIRHAIVAVGSLHEQFGSQTVKSEANRTFAFQYYTLAIRDLLVPLHQSGKRGTKK